MSFLASLLISIIGVLILILIVVIINIICTLLKLRHISKEIYNFKEFKPHKMVFSDILSYDSSNCKFFYKNKEINIPKDISSRFNFIIKALRIIDKS